MRCLDQYRDSMVQHSIVYNEQDITEEGIKESIVTNIAHERAGIDTSYHEFCISFAQMTNNVIDIIRSHSLGKTAS